MASFLIGDYFGQDVMGPYGAFLEAKIKKEAIFVISLMTIIEIIVKQTYGYLWMRLIEEITKMASFLILASKNAP